MTCVDYFLSKKTNYRVWLKVRVRVGTAGKHWTECVPCGRRETRGVATGLQGWGWIPSKSDCTPSVPTLTLEYMFGYFGFPDKKDRLYCSSVAYHRAASSL